MSFARRFGFLIAVLTVVPVTFAQSVPGNGFAGSAHDFTALAASISGTGARATACVFCHLEDGMGGASTSLAGALLSWSQKAATQSFFWSAAVSQAGTRLPSNLTTWAGSSRLCLACHGDTAVPSSPGDPGYQLAYAADVNGRVDDSGRLPLWGRMAVQKQVDGSPFGMMTAALAAKHVRIGAGGNLDGTHAVGVPYPYQGVPGTYNRITTGKGIDLKRYVPVPRHVKLFTARGARVVAGAQVGATGIECASCHDVHNKEVAGQRLLRDTVAQLCLDCHTM